MKQIARLLFLAILITGCDQHIKPAAPVASKSVQRPTKELVSSWAKMGMYMPDASQVAAFRGDFEHSEDLLRNGLDDSNSSVRMRSAYVIGEIGTIARPLGASLLMKLSNEEDELVKIYMVNALSEIGHDTPSTVQTLTTLFDSLDGTNVPPSFGGSYAEVDQKINLAAAIFVLSKPEDSGKYFDFVTKWLDPPEPSVRGLQLDGYWERRWMAVNCLGRMTRAVEAIPKLEMLQSEPKPKPWVSVHVPRVLDILQRGNR